MTQPSARVSPVLAIVVTCVVLMAACANCSDEQGAHHEHHGKDCAMAGAGVQAPEAGAEGARREGNGVQRTKRQFQFPQLPQQGAGGNSLIQKVGELSAQVDRIQAPLKMITSMFNKQQQQQGSPASSDQTWPAAVNQAAAQQSSSLPNAGSFMSTFTDFVRSTNNSSQNLATNVQQGGQQAEQQGTAAAQNAQGGIAAALTEIGAGLQRIATNNPNLMPDVKSLYSSVSDKLSSASQSAAQAAPKQAEVPAVPVQA